MRVKNAIIPVVTYIGPMFSGLLTGSFVIERLFSVAGIGRFFVNSIENRDYTMIMATTIIDCCASDIHQFPGGYHVWPD